MLTGDAHVATTAALAYSETFLGRPVVPKSNGRNGARQTRARGGTAGGGAVRRAGAVARDLAVGGLSAPRDHTNTPHLLSEKAEADFEQTVRRQLELIGEDPAREGLLRTPRRVARSMAWITRGYHQDAWSAVGEGVFEEAHDHMVMVRDIELYSLCEHHLLPFFGKAHIAYIPSGRIVGLSKLPRLVEIFSRRLQVQERLTGQIADAIEEVLKPRGVGVVIEAQHLCMMMRGVEKQNSKTITSALLGSFRDDAKTRDEFLRLAHATA